MSLRQAPERHPRESEAGRVAQRRHAVAAAFAPGGELAGAMAGFTPRRSQQEMALAIFDTIVERETLAAEAGTGTGKTFAYLVPALLAGGRVLLSAGTKTLQDQIFGRDLPAVCRALGVRADVALLKGRQNYVCRLRLERTEASGMLATREETVHLRAISRFARASSSGDRSELDEVPETATIWPAVTSTRDNCLGGECPHFDACFVYRARRRALGADVVVVNHHLFLADLALRDGAVSELLPLADTVVLDEAHHLPRIAAEFFGHNWSLSQATELGSDALTIGLAHARDGAAWPDLARSLEQAARALRATLADAGVAAGTRVAFDRLSSHPPLRQSIGALARAVASLQQALRSNEGRDAELDLLAPRAGRLLELLQAWEIGDAPPDPAPAEAPPADEVRWIAASAHGAQFCSTPLSAAEAFARVREAETQAWILTSATLTVAQRFEPFLDELGLSGARTLSWDSPFDFQRQALLYLPQPLPDPAADDFPERVADAAWPVIAASGGRAFVLCSTLRAVARVAERLRGHIRSDAAGLPLLVQGDSTRRALLDRFRRSGDAVLVGSVSFWEGIDVRGEALSLVVIDKLPFAPPDDPVVEAKIRRLRALGRNPFPEYQLPQAVTLLRQGVGRLIRDEHDRGVLMILDQRLLSRSYGKVILASLPPFSRTRSQALACAFVSGLTGVPCDGPAPEPRGREEG